MDLARVQRAIALRRRVRPWRVPDTAAVVSVSFDDIPASAASLGAAVLETVGVRGMFYCAGSLAGRTDHGAAMFNDGDLRRLQAAGHEIGCHTWSHLDCQRAGPDAMAADLDRNAAYLREHTGQAPQHFSYPFGLADVRAKRVAAQRFVTARGIRGGVNRGLADLAQLRANALYQRNDDVARLRTLIDQTATAGGWLILYTHDVSETPGPFGCTPDTLQSLLEMARGCGCELLGVAEAAASFGIPAPRPRPEHS